MAEALVNVETVSCPVCYELFKDPRVLSCAHLQSGNSLENVLNTHLTQTAPRGEKPFSRGQKSMVEKTSGDVGKDVLTVNHVSGMMGKMLIAGEERLCIVHDVVDATSRCTTCDILLCDMCVDVHRKVPLTSLHNVEDLAPDRLAAGLKDECSSPAARAAEFYCESHKSINCQPCISASHSKCPNVTCLDDLLRQYRGYLMEVQATLIFSESALKQAMTNLDARMSFLQVKSDITLHDIEKMCKRLIDSIKCSEARLKHLVQTMNDKALTSALELKTILFQSRERIASHLTLLLHLQQAQLDDSAKGMVDLHMILDHFKDVATDAILPANLTLPTFDEVTVESMTTSSMQQEMETIDNLVMTNVLIGGQSSNTFLKDAKGLSSTSVQEPATFNKNPYSWTNRFLDLHNHRPSGHPRVNIQKRKEDTEEPEKNKKR